MPTITMTDINAFAGFSGHIDTLRGLDDEGERNPVPAPWRDMQPALDALQDAISDIEGDETEEGYAVVALTDDEAATARLVLADAVAHFAASGTAYVDAVTTDNVTITD